ncbi:BREX system P-loop protein BrxC [Methylicorpusculum sp.]|uniref:BREX system P-loop protein BrxC n=1 Tax=Methylicorpusculum sp. TaxID=2713644 RepID=UPI002ABCEF68|nr:BREX system P-loop protein BrxC [Methylicorpusculum sp.]MDZ4150886.1 BREX system P-loop protein BrxC [Methylicorpusculum sp.]
MTTLKTIFHKPVDRPIDGVIKADDEASLRLEIEEYVLTNEVEKRLESFLDAYNNYEGANGVWVSGFFGSGKSHLLKMLALLLEGRQIDGSSALELFLPKCGDNEILRGDLKRAISIPSRSILFNIDQKADVISKTQIDALLAVFVKVFDEMCGYYGKQAYIAQFERDLDKDNLLDDFKKAFFDLAGNDWNWGCSRPARVSSFVDDAFNRVTQQNQKDVLDKCRQDYRLSIEDFADQVYAYIERQAPDFRLNFFVDEVGQYVADNVKLMTNLQTIAESLATKCRGRAWVIVTAQEDMGTVVGEMGKQQGNDFSKIQARFANRMKLTSADVAEVIQKRLLTKNEAGVGLLSNIYHAQSNNFKTLFDFADGSVTYRNYLDRDHFIHSYPFIPYQFALFQSAIQNLSLHNAFEGKHSSVGERSMLGVFQQVAIQIEEHEIGQLATFDLMFEGIRSALKSQIQRAIILAENNLDNPFAIRLLKTLFLVKYVKEFKPTLRNLCILMLEGFNQDLPVLKKRVEEALNLLEQQTYVQRNGELYDYLTDEEKDVEEEIKNTEVETTDVASELEKIVFDHVLKQRKLRYDALDQKTGGQDYAFTRKLDERLFGREYELCIHVISPFHEHADNQTALVMHAYGRDELLLVLPSDDRLVRDILMYKRTEKYIRQNISVTQQEAIKRILNDKGFQNRERYADIQQRVQRLMGKAKLFVAGSEIEIGSEDAQTRVLRGFHELVARVYPNLRMLRGINYTENDIAKCLKYAEDGLFGNDVTSLAESEQELLAFIQSNHRGGVRTTLKSLLERFERKPYGWYYAAVLCTLANLCARGKVEARTDGNLLEENELERALRNTHGHGNLVLEPQVEFTASQLRVLKEFYEDFFDTPPRASEAKALGNETAEAFQEITQQLIPLAAQTARYPFLNALNPVLEKLKELNGKPYTWYLSELARQEDSLLAMKEGVIDPIRKFMSGPQKAIFDDARTFVQTQEPNFAYVISDVPASIQSVLNDPTCFKGNRIQQIKSDLDALAQEIDKLVEEVRSQAIEKLQTLQQRMQGQEEYKKLPDVRMAELDAPYQELIGHIQQQSLIAVINDRLRYFEEQGYQKLLSKLIDLTAPKPAPSAKSTDLSEGDRDKPISEPRPEYISSRKINVTFDKAWLADETDVERYLESMREALLLEIRKGKRIQI